MPGGAVCRWRRPVWDEHEAILQAINCGAAALAERLAREHCAGASDHMATQLTCQVRTLPERLAWQGAMTRLAYQP